MTHFCLSFAADMQQIRSTVVGSWPKPEWLFHGLPSHSGNGEGVKSGFVEGVTEEMRDRATKEAIDDQITAGLMNVSDGEMRRGAPRPYHPVASRRATRLIASERSHSREGARHTLGASTHMACSNPMSCRRELHLLPDQARFRGRRLRDQNGTCPARWS